MAFQVVDDLLDLTGDQADTGKSVGRDLAFGNATLPIIHHLSTAPSQDQGRLRAVVTGERVADMEQVRAWLEGTGSIEYAYNRAREYVRTALDKLGLFPRSAARESLCAITEFILRRHF